MRGVSFRRTRREPPVTQEHEFHYEMVARPESEAVVYRLSGVMGESKHCYDFLEEFLEALEAAPALIVFNLGELDNMYSSGIGIVANCFTKSKEKGKRLVITDVPEVIDRTLTITGIQPMLKQYESEADALAATA